MSGADLTTCAGKIGEFAGVSAESQKFLYGLGVKYWKVLDPQSTDAVDFATFKKAVAALAATNARVIMKACDEGKFHISVFSKIVKIFKSVKDTFEYFLFQS